MSDPRDRDLRELAEGVTRLCYGYFGTRYEDTDQATGEAEDLIRAFLAELEVEQAGALAALRGALEEIFERAHVAGGEDALNCRECHWILGRADEALAPGAGKAEAEVLRAAVHHEEVAEEWLGAMERGPASDLPGSPIYHKLAKAKDALSDAVDALLAARGGEGEG